MALTDCHRLTMLRVLLPFVLAAALAGVKTATAACATGSSIGPCVAGTCPAGYTCSNNQCNCATNGGSGTVHPAFIGLLHLKLWLTFDNAKIYALAHRLKTRLFLGEYKNNNNKIIRYGKLVFFYRSDMHGHRHQLRSEHRLLHEHRLCVVDEHAVPQNMRPLLQRHQCVVSGHNEKIFITKPKPTARDISLRRKALSQTRSRA